MKKILVAIAAVLLLQSMVSSASADEAMKNAIGARQADMTLRAFNISQLGAMAKGALPYDAKMAQAAADNLLALVNMKSMAAWVKGSGADNPELASLTRAKGEIWTTYPKIAERGKALKTAAAALAGTAGNGVDGIRANIGAVGKACGGCHKEFRLEKQ